MSEETLASMSQEAAITNCQAKFSGSDIDVLRAWATDTDKVSCFCTLDIQISIDKTVACLKNGDIPYTCLQVIYSEGIHMGLIFVTPASGNYDKCRAKVGFCLDKMYWGRGIIKSVLKKMIPIIFQAWPALERLEAKVQALDGVSQNTLEGAGFQIEGVLRKYRILEGKAVDVAMYSFLSSDLQF